MTKLFEDYYTQTHTRWRINQEKAGKDIVGEEYEKMRTKFWKSYDFSVSKTSIADFTPDLIIKRGRSIVAIEECKAHYVDSCFLDRFAMDAAKIFNHYIEKKTPNAQIPKIILSSMTTYNHFERKTSDILKVFKPEIVKLFKSHVHYFSFCKHDRVPARKYFQHSSLSTCFTLDPKLIKKQEDFANSL